MILGSTKQQRNKGELEGIEIHRDDLEECAEAIVGKAIARETGNER